MSVRRLPLGASTFLNKCPVLNIRSFTDKMFSTDGGDAVRGPGAPFATELPGRRCSETGGASAEKGGPSRAADPGAAPGGSARPHPREGLRGALRAGDHRPRE